MLIPLRTDETFSKRTWSGLILGLLGSAIVILAKMGIQLTTTTSLLYSLAALVAITIGTVREKRFGIPQPASTKNLVQYVIGPIFVLPVA
jgi:drug/metabolite transporter (DMT)-like permease